MLATKRGSSPLEISRDAKVLRQDLLVSNPKIILNMGGE